MLTDVVAERAAAAPAQPIAPQRRRGPLLWLGSVLLGVGITGLPLLFSSRFYYLDDTQNQGMGSMHLVGRLIRDGELASVMSQLGAGGNLAVDPQYGLFFPPKLALSVFVSLFDDVNLAAILIMAFFNVVLCLGVVLLLRQGGASPLLSLAGAGSIATSGFLFLWSTNWQPNLWSYALVPWLWLALERRNSVLSVASVTLLTWLIVGFAFPFATVAAAGLCFAWFLGRLLVRRDPFRTLLPKILAGGAGVLIGAIAYLPLASSIDWTVRRSEITNDGTLVPNLTELFLSSSPVASTEISFWGGQVASSPIMYLGWFLLPLVALIDWKSVRWRSGLLPTAAVFTVVILLLTQLPSDFGAIRWPFRFLSGVAIAITVLLISAVVSGGVKVTRVRAGLAYGSVLLAAFLSYGRNPIEVRQTIAWMIVDLILVTALLLAASQRWRAGVAGVALIGVFAGQAAMIIGLGPRGQNPDVGDWGAPARISELGVPPVPEKTPGLVLRGRDPEAEPARLEDGIGVGYVSTYHDRYLGQSYSSVSQRYLHGATCADYLGYTCPQAGEFLLAEEPRTGQRWLDLLGYEYLMLGPEYGYLEDALGSGWEEVESDEVFTTWQKTADVARADITYTDPGVTIGDGTVAGDTHTYTVDAPDGGLVVLREVAWPGWKAELDGRPLQPVFLENILVGVELPEGASGELVVRYDAIPTGPLALAGIGALLLIAASQGVYLLERRRNARKETR